jgi:uncharacterized protein YabE (DUF348 family)/3D (Asp-Asp-Asp) domain-containing protein
LAYWLEGVRAEPEHDSSSRPRSADSTGLGSARGRLRLALIISLIIVGVLTFAVFPAKKRAITADGTSVAVVSRESDTQSLLSLAGVQPEIGDVLIQDGKNLTIDRAIPVLVNVDNKTLSWRTRARTVEDLLSEMGISTSPYDGIRYNGVDVGLKEALIPQETISLSIHRAVPFTLVEDGRAVSLQTSRETLSQTLQDLGITLGPADVISPSPSAPVVAGMHVEVKHARAINLRSGNAVTTLYTQKTTLREALAEVGLTLGDEDRVEPGLDALVSNNMDARLVRVSGQSFFDRTTVERKTVLKADPSLSAGQTRRVNGTDGTLVKEYKLVIEDGVETERTFVKQYFEPEVQDNVIYYAPGATSNVGYNPGITSIAEVKHVWATWYNPASSGKPLGDKAYNVTKTGTSVEKGVVAVDPSVIPLGTHMFIPGYGFAIAADTGGGIIGDMVDLGFPDGAPVDWHTGAVDIYILSP